MVNPALLWAAPEVNPVNGKARTIPFLNPINIYGRVFFFSWFGFFLAFWSWYAFPPLVSRAAAHLWSTFPDHVPNGSRSWNIPSPKIWG